jgi:hypothetical protein
MNVLICYDLVYITGVAVCLGQTWQVGNRNVPSSYEQRASRVIVPKATRGIIASGRLSERNQVKLHHSAPRARIFYSLWPDTSSRCSASMLSVLILHRLSLSPFRTASSNIPVDDIQNEESIKSTLLSFLLISAVTAARNKTPSSIQIYIQYKSNQNCLQIL